MGKIRGILISLALGVFALVLTWHIFPHPCQWLFALAATLWAVRDFLFDEQDQE